MKDRTEKREEDRIGRFLADSMENLEPLTPCLSEDELDNLVSGRISAERSDAALEHIAACPVCRHSYVISRRFAVEDARELPKISRFPVRYMAPLALAASLVLTIGLYRLLPRGKEMPQVSSAPAPALAPAPDTRQAVTVPPVGGAKQQSPGGSAGLKAVAGVLEGAGRGGRVELRDSAARGFGFSAAGGTEGDLYHAGFTAVALSNACRSEDAGVIRRSVSRLDERLRKLDLGDSVKGELQRRFEVLAAQPVDRTACGKLFEDAVAAIGKRYPDNEYVQLGGWMATVVALTRGGEAGRLKDSPFLAAAGRAATLSSPEGVAERVREMVTLVSGPLDAAAARRLQELAEEIQGLF